MRVFYTTVCIITELIPIRILLPIWMLPKRVFLFFAIALQPQVGQDRVYSNIMHRLDIKSLGINNIVNSAVDDRKK